MIRAHAITVAFRHVVWQATTTGDRVAAVVLVLGLAIAASPAVAAPLEFNYLLLDKARVRARKPSLYVFRCVRHGTCKVLRRYPARYGLSKGPKQKQGDFKTPEGLYRIVKRRKNRSNTHFKYGPYSLWINYPNAQDRARGVRNGYNPGYGITIHGGRAYNTEGCIRILDGAKRPGRRNMAELAIRFSAVGTNIRIIDGLLLRRRLRIGDSLPASLMGDVKSYRGPMARSCPPPGVVEMDRSRVPRRTYNKARDTNNKGYQAYKRWKKDRRRTSDFKAAMRLWKEALRLRPSHTIARYNLACGFAQAGDKEAALCLLRQIHAKLYDRRCFRCRRQINHARLDPDLDSLRGDPGLAAMLKE